jgi:hypothetical protein
MDRADSVASRPSIDDRARRPHQVLEQLYGRATVVQLLAHEVSTAGAVTVYQQRDQAFEVALRLLSILVRVARISIASAAWQAAIGRVGFARVRVCGRVAFRGAGGFRSAPQRTNRAAKAAVEVIGLRHGHSSSSFMERLGRVPVVPFDRCVDRDPLGGRVLRRPHSIATHAEVDKEARRARVSRLDERAA